MKNLLRIKYNTVEVHYPGKEICKQSYHDYILEIFRERLETVGKDVKTFTEGEWGRKKEFAKLLDVDAAIITRFDKRGFSCSYDLLEKVCQGTMGYKSMHSFLFGVDQAVPAPPLLEWIKDLVLYLTDEEFAEWMHELAIYDEKQFRRNLLPPSELAVQRITDLIAWKGGTPIWLPVEYPDAFIKLWVKNSMKDGRIQGRLSSLMMTCWYFDMPVDYWLAQDYSSCGIVSVVDGQESAWSELECKLISKYLKLNTANADKALQSLVRYATPHIIAGEAPDKTIDKIMKRYIDTKN